MDPAKLALVVSAAALVVSILALWVSSLLPFRLKVSHDTPTFTLYRIAPSVSGDELGRTWWIPSFDLGLSFYNVGRRPGEVLDVRIAGEFKGYRNTRRYVFYPKWIVDYSKFQQSPTERFEWINDAIVREWYPFLLDSHAEQSLHVVLETDRWDQRETGSMQLKLEYISSAKRQWMTAAEYDFAITEDMFDEKATHTPYDKKLEALRSL